MQVWHVLHVAIAENTERKKSPKIRHLAPLHNFVGLYLHNEGTYRQSEKTYYTSSTCPHNMANFGPLTAEIGSGVWDTPAKFQRVSRLGGTLVLGVSQTLQRWTNGATYIYSAGRPTLGIGPHSSFFSSPNFNGRRLDVYHTSTHGVALVRI